MQQPASAGAVGWSSDPSPASPPSLVAPPLDPELLPELDAEPPLLDVFPLDDELLLDALPLDDALLLLDSAPPEDEPASMGSAPKTVASPGVGGGVAPTGSRPVRPPQAAASTRGTASSPLRCLIGRPRAFFSA